jgi:nucleoside phosphorylase
MPLSVEYLAVRAHLSELREEVHTQGTVYERGQFLTAGQSWEVGIVEVGPGNPSAAVEAERAIGYFSPDVIFFVGVAGGIKDVTIGDVVAATEVYSYEFGKAGETFRTRPKSRDADYGLEQRARAEARKGGWLQRLARVPDPAPKVFVGPIAAGEKVIASQQSAIFQLLRSHYEDAIAVEMEGFGFLLAVRGHKQVDAIVIRGISDLIDGKAKADRGGSQEMAACHASAFAFQLLAKFQTITPDPITSKFSLVSQLPFKDSGVNVTPQTGEIEKPLLILSVQSMSTPVDLNGILTGFNEDLKRREREFVSLDFRALAKGGTLNNPASAVQQLINTQGVLSSAIARFSEVELVFHGLGHIPLLVLIGHLVSDRVPVHLFDFHPSPGSNTWAWAEDGQNFPTIQTYGLPNQHSWQPKDVVLRISVTYRVSPEQTRTVTPPDAIEIDLALPNPERSIIRSEKQTREYGKIFRQTLDVIAQNLPTNQRIHLFYAGPVALAFHLGQQISENIHPPVIVWNFHRRYDWAIDLAAAYIGEDSVIRPS